MQNQKKYNCTQQEFYAAANLAWQNYQANLTDFSSHKGKYTAIYGDDAVAALLEAKALPDDQSRSSLAEALRIQLAQASDVCLNNWQSLKSYIADAFPVDMQKTKLDAAGAKYYRGAANENWMQMQSLLGTANKFITDNTTILSQGGNNMPATFPAKFATDKTAFETKYAEFIAAEQGSAGGTNAKIAANNDCYDTLVKMLADGQIIYRNNEAKKELFVFETVLGYVRAPGTTGLRIAAEEIITELPVADFAVIAQPGNVQGATDENGVVILSLSEGTYTLTGLRDGYEPVNMEVEITTGVVSRKKVILTKAA